MHFRYFPSLTFLEKRIILVSGFRFNGNEAIYDFAQDHQDLFLYPNNKGIVDVGKTGSLLQCIVLSLKLSGSVLVFLSIVTCLPGTSLSTDRVTVSEIKQPTTPYSRADITIKIIHSVNNTFGYDILLHGRPFVHQPNIPGLPGNSGFATKAKAQAVAELVVNKIRNNEIPPTVTIEDLNTMGVFE